MPPLGLSLVATFPFLKVLVLVLVLVVLMVIVLMVVVSLHRCVPPPWSEPGCALGIFQGGVTATHRRPPLVLQKTGPSM